MISHKTYALVILMLFIFMSCSEDNDNEVITIENTPPTYTVNILPLGDSRVQGNRPNHESYRFELWKNFIANDWTVDLLGPNTDTSEYPLYEGLDFDTNHAGVGGYTTELILNTLESTLDAVDMPDVVLLGIGGVDLIRNKSYEEAVVNIHLIIDQLQDHNPDLTIFIEQIAPAKSDSVTDADNALLQDFNNAVIVISEERTTSNSKVIPINMAEGWNDILLADDVHYNALGAKFVADKYFDAIDEHVE